MKEKGTLSSEKSYSHQDEKICSPQVQAEAKLIIWWVHLEAV